MEQQSESPLSPLGQELLESYADRRTKNLPLDPACEMSLPPWVLLLWLILPFGLSDFLFGLIIDLNDSAMSARSLGYKTFVGLLLAVCFGLFPLQAVLLSSYAVFSSEHWWVRLLIYCPLVMGLSLAGLAGMYVLYQFKGWSIDEMEVENGVRFLCVMPAIAVASQIPLWIMRSFFGWRLVRVHSTAEAKAEAHSEPSQSLSILHLMLATAIVGVCLGALRLAPTETLEAAELWFVVGVFSGIAAGVSLIGGVPLVRLFSQTRNQWLAWGLALGVPLVIGAITLTYIAWDRSWMEIKNGGMLFGTAMFVVVGLTFILGMAGSLRLWRFQGWTIQRVPAHSA